MNKTILLLLIIVSCKNLEKEVDSIAIAEQYYKGLNHLDHSTISDLLADSITTTEGNHKQTYSKNHYLEFLKWDVVFDPNYEILEIELDKKIAIAKISKTDKRISFFHEKPFIILQTLKFDNNKIKGVETTYVNFNDDTWGKNRSALLSWVEENHPELNGFIHDQQRLGVENF